jgi:hypothetical protein
MSDNISTNPLDYVTIEELLELGLTSDDIAEAYQPSSGGVYHARGAESQGKTLWIAHDYRYLIDKKFFTPDEAVGNMTFKGKYAQGYQVLKGDDLRQYLWDLTHKPYRHKIVIIDEIDSEFPARMFVDKEQTEIALRLWHTAKLGNYIFMSSHLGNSTDLIMHLASHYYIYPRKPDFATNTMNFSLVNILDLEIDDTWTAYDIIKTMLIYSRRELTEQTEEEQNKIRPSLRQNKKHQVNDFDFELDIEKEAILCRVSSTLKLFSCVFGRFCTCIMQDYFCAIDINSQSKNWLIRFDYFCLCHFLYLLPLLSIAHFLLLCNTFW